jgi:hypothetical protein
LPGAARGPALLRVGLGLFIVWQVAFLVASNATDYLSHIAAADGESGPNRGTQVVAAVTSGWVRLTGQAQNWRMFAPQVPMRALFLQVDFDEVGVPSESAAVAEGTYCHPPGGGDRLWHVEKTVAWPLVAYDPEAVDARPDEWHAYLEQAVRNNERACRSYLAWRQHAWLREHPGQPPPRAIYLVVRVYTLSRQGERPGPVACEVLLRARPRPDNPEQLTLELARRRPGLPPLFAPLRADPVPEPKAVP